MIILGLSEAAITMVCDILVSKQYYPPISILNNLGIKSNVPYDNPMFEMHEFSEVQSVISESDYILGAMMPETKHKLYSLFKFDKSRFVNLLHSSSSISNTAKIGHGVMVDAQANISAHVNLGDFTTVYAGSTISHHCNIGDYCTICPNAVLAGNVTVGEQTFIGVGACIKNGIKIGSKCVIGAGAVVVKDVPNGITVKGNPAK